MNTLCKMLERHKNFILNFTSFSSIVVCISCIFRLTDSYLLIGKINQDTIFYTFLLILNLDYQLASYIKTDKKLKKFFVVTFCTLLAFGCIWASIVSVVDYEYYHYTSPDNSHEILIRSDDIISQKGLYIYEKRLPFIYDPINRSTRIDSMDSLKVEWLDNDTVKAGYMIDGKHEEYIKEL